VYLTLAPKSNAAYRALGAARAYVREHGSAPPPPALQSPPRGYDYPHDRPGHISPQELLPDPVVGTRFYAPDDAEAALRERLHAILQARGR
jgi:putative ATPase